MDFRKKFTNIGLYIFDQYIIPSFGNLRSRAWTNRLFGGEYYTSSLPDTTKEDKDWHVEVVTNAQGGMVVAIHSFHNQPAFDSANKREFVFLSILTRPFLCRNLQFAWTK